MESNLENDLCLQWLNLKIQRGDVPDELSEEYWGENEFRDDSSVIYFRWSQIGRDKIFGHTPERYRIVWNRFNEYWNSIN